MLSGYLISGIIIKALEKGAFTFRDFYARRINRIFPALTVVLLGTFALGWYLLFRTEFLSLGKHIAAGAAFLSNAALVQETGYFDAAAERKPLLHLWSLAIEEQFYLFWPLLLFLSWRFRRRFVVPAIAIGAASYLLALTLAYAGDPTTAFYLPFTRLWELTAGFALFVSAGNAQTPRDAKHADLKSIIGFMLILASVFVANATMPWPGAWTLMPVFGAVLVISAGPGSVLNSRLLGHPAMVWIGLISYPLYLWHWPLLAFARFIQPTNTSSLLIFGAVALAFLLAWLTFRFVEFPIRSRVSGRGRQAIILVAALAVTGLLGGAAASGAITVRLDSPQIRAIQDALVDWQYPGGGTRQENAISGSADTVLFAGDSHMEQYWPRIDSLVRSSQGRLPTAVFMTKRACPTFPGVGRKGVPACAALYPSIMKRAASDGISTVVLNSYWDDFFRRELLFRLTDPQRKPVKLDEPAADSMFVALERDLARLVSAGKKVFVVLTIPIGANDEFNPRGWLPDRLDPSKEVFVIPAIDRVEFEERMAPVQQRVRHAALRAGAVVIDPVPYLCGVTDCRKADTNGNPFYMDGRHLRASVAQSRAVWIDTVLNWPLTERNRTGRRGPQASTKILMLDSGTPSENERRRFASGIVSGIL